MSQKILHLTVKKEWFDKIASSEKTIEYREIKEHWVKRFLNISFSTPAQFSKSLKIVHFSDKYQKEAFDDSVKKYDLIIFKNGYAKNAPTIIAEWGGLSIVWQPNDLGIDRAFAINIGKILSITNKDKK